MTTNQPDSPNISARAADSCITRPKQPFLRKGRGFETRIAASQARKYIPKGGFIKTVEQHLPKLSKLKQLRLARAALSEPLITSSKGTFKRGAQSSGPGSPRPAAKQGVHRRQHQHTTGQRRLSHTATPSSDLQQSLATPETTSAGGTCSQSTPSPAIKGKLELVQTPQNQPSDGEEVTPSAGQSAAQKEIAANLPQQLHSAQLEPVQQETSHLELPDILIRTESEVDSPSDAETAASSRDETVLQQNEPDRQLQELAATNKSTSATTYRAEGMPVNRLPAAHKAVSRHTGQKLSMQEASKPASVRGIRQAAQASGKALQSPESCAALQRERGQVAQLRQQLHLGAQQLERDRAAFARSQAEQRDHWEQKHRSEARRLKRDRELLDRQTSALARLPTASERREAEGLEAILQTERKAAKARDARQKLEVDRLTRKVADLQRQVTELREEVTWFEQQRLADWEASETGKCPASARQPGPSKPSQRLPDKPKAETSQSDGPSSPHTPSPILTPRAARGGSMATSTSKETHVSAKPSQSVGSASQRQPVQQQDHGQPGMHVPQQGQCTQQASDSDEQLSAPEGGIALPDRAGGELPTVAAGHLPTALHTLCTAVHPRTGQQPGQPQPRGTARTSAETELSRGAQGLPKPEAECRNSSGVAAPPLLQHWAHSEGGHLAEVDSVHTQAMTEPMQPPAVPVVCRRVGPTRYDIDGSQQHESSSGYKGEEQSFLRHPAEQHAASAEPEQGGSHLLQAAASPGQPAAGGEATVQAEPDANVKHLAISEQYVLMKVTDQKDAQETDLLANTAWPADKPPSTPARIPTEGRQESLVAMMLSIDPPHRGAGSNPMPQLSMLAETSPLNNLEPRVVGQPCAQVLPRLLDVEAIRTAASPAAQCSNTAPAMELADKTAAGATPLQDGARKAAQPPSSPQRHEPAQLPALKHQAYSQETQQLLEQQRMLFSRQPPAQAPIESPTALPQHNKAGSGHVAESTSAELARQKAKPSARPAQPSSRAQHAARVRLASAPSTGRPIPEATVTPAPKPGRQPASACTPELTRASQAQRKGLPARQGSRGDSPGSRPAPASTPGACSGRGSAGRAPRAGAAAGAGCPEAAPEGGGELNGTPPASASGPQAAGPDLEVPSWQSSKSVQPSHAQTAPSQERPHVIVFANGASREDLSSGASITRFANGDVKHTCPEGPEDYFYAEVQTWHRTWPHGTEVFYFPSGQTEAHHSGCREVVLADGSARFVLPSGAEVPAAKSQLSAEVQQPGPAMP